MEPSPDSVVNKPPDEEKQHFSKDDEPHPMEFDFECKEELFEDYENASDFPIQAKYVTHNFILAVPNHGLGKPT